MQIYTTFFFVFYFFSIIVFLNEFNIVLCDVIIVLWYSLIKENNLPEAKGSW